MARNFDYSLFLPTDDPAGHSVRNFEKDLLQLVDGIIHLNPLKFIQIRKILPNMAYSIKKIMKIKEIIPNLINSKDILIIIDGEKFQDFQILMDRIEFKENSLNDNSPVPYFCEDYDFELFLTNIVQKYDNISVIYIFHDLQSISVWSKRGARQSQS